MPGVILYGPPAAGKDTVASTLVRLHPRYMTFRRLKIGGGRASGYRMTTAEDVAELAGRGEIVYENHRYGASYYVDRSGIAKLLRNGIPIVQLGQREGVEAMLRGFPEHRWLVVSLWCTREVAARRIADRGTQDEDQRLQAWDATERIASDVTIDTGIVDAEAAARQIDAAVSPLSPVSPASPRPADLQ